MEPHPHAAARAQSMLTRVIVAPFPSAEIEAEESFDLVVFADSLEHIADPWHALDVAARHLSPDGHLLVSVPNISHYSVILQQFRGRWDYATEGLLDKGHLRFFTPKTIQEVLAAHGFCVIDMACSMSKPHRRLARPGVALIERWKPHLLWYQILVVARHI